MGFFDKLRDGLSRTKQQIVSRFEEIVETADRPEQRTRPVDVDTIEALEELLISADVGLAATTRAACSIATTTSARTISVGGAEYDDVLCTLPTKRDQPQAVPEAPIRVTRRPSV